MLAAALPVRNGEASTCVTESSAHMKSKPFSRSIFRKLTRTRYPAGAAKDTAQLAEFTENGEGPVATTELVFRPYNSSPIVQTDAWTVVFD